jgi:hypothetical protein
MAPAVDGIGIAVLPWHAGMRWSLGLLVLSRAALLCLAPFAEPYKRPHFNADHTHGYYWHSTETSPFFEISRNIYWDMWARSDSWQYLQIAEAGYYLEPGPSGYGTVACFPLYPLAVGMVAHVLGGHYLEVALAISSVAAWGACVLLYRIAAEWSGVEFARRATIGLFAFPFAFFLTTVFPHSLFLLLCLASLVAANRGAFIAAGLLAALASATRAEGVVLGPTLALAYGQRFGFSLNRSALGLVLAPMGFLAYVSYLWWLFDRPLAFLDIHSQFGRAPTNPLWTFVRPLVDHLFNIRHFLTYIVAAWLGWATYRRIPAVHMLFGWLLFLVPLCTGQYESIYRVQLTTYPIYLGMAAVVPRWLFWLQIAVLALLQLFVCFGFIIGVRLN